MDVPFRWPCGPRCQSETGAPAVAHRPHDPEAGNAGVHTGTARERETPADDAAPRPIGATHAPFHDGRGVQEDPIMGVSPGGGLPLSRALHKDRRWTARGATRRCAALKSGVPFPAPREGEHGCAASLALRAAMPVRDRRSRCRAVLTVVVFAPRGTCGSSMGCGNQRRGRPRQYENCGLAPRWPPGGRCGSLHPPA